MKHNGTSAEQARVAAMQRPRPPGPAFVTVGAYRAAQGRDAPPHRYATWKIAYYVEGHIRTNVGEQSYAVRPGTMLVVPPGVAHSEIADTPYANVYLLVHAPARWPWPCKLAPDATENVRAILLSLLREADKEPQDAFSGQIIDALLTQLDLEIRRRAGGGPPSRAAVLVRRAENLMRERHATNLTITEVARELGLSTSGLRASFAAELGTSPQSRLMSIRLSRAVSLLANSTLTVESVAQRSGFHSASHLTRNTQRHLGRTPAQLRSDNAALTDAETPGLHDDDLPALK
jgi:AraC-like DNA-binding protein/quercetin dioxygenase-like cupin family protein